MRFDSYHPAINFIFFTIAIGCTAWFHHPVFVGISYVCAFAYSIKLKGVKALIFNVVLIPLAILYAGWYAYYNHFGVTNLKTNIIGNQITLEALVFGTVIAFTAAAILMWLECLHELITADKVVYLLGRVSPKLSLFVSILLRMVPRTKARAKKINTAQRGIGRGTCDGNILRRIVNVFRELSILIMWLIESLVESSSSMRCRGYGLKGRTAYSIYRFDNRDRSFVIGLFACVSMIIAAVLLDQTQIHYDPQIIFNRITAVSVFFYLAYAVFLLLPMALQIIGEKRFDRLIEKGAGNVVPERS